jgi:hypothetical protein
MTMLLLSLLIGFSSPEHKMLQGRACSQPTISKLWAHFESILVLEITNIFN